MVLDRLFIKTKFGSDFLNGISTKQKHAYFDRQFHRHIFLSSENRAKIKESVARIADSLLEQDYRYSVSKDLDKLATRGDVALLRDEIALARDDTKKLKILDSKYDLLKWLITAQLTIASLLLALIM